MRRARWRRYRSIVGDRVMLVIDGVCFGEANRFRGEPRWFVGVEGTDVYDYVPRCSDAKSWLLARAAGLAEVPRRVRVGPRGGSWSYVRRDAHTVWPPPGWHEVEEYIGADGEVGVVLCERDRRRR